MINKDYGWVPLRGPVSMIRCTCVLNQSRWKPRSRRVFSLSIPSSRIVRGNMWMALNSGGLFLLDSTKGVFQSYTQSWPKCFATIYHITEDKLTGNYWLGTDSGLILYDISRREYYSYNHNPLGLPCFRGDYFKGGNPGYNLDANNILWAVIWKSDMAMHIYRYEITTGNMTEIPSTTGSIWTFLTDASGITWAYGEYLYRYDQTKKRIY